MSDEDFLTRWSRRKRAVEEEAAKAHVEPRPDGDLGRGDDASPAAPHAESKPEEEFDLASLPPLDSITGASDVTVFLRKGVPTDLTRAALRRAWVADPNIRDFAVLAENAWDFNDPTAMPGFGPLDHSPEQVRQMVSELLGETRRVAEEVADMSAELEPAPETTNDSSALSSLPPREPVVESGEEDRRTEVTALSALAPANGDGEKDAATHQNESRNMAQPRRRPHGGALPQ
jgi:hypothetical protein